MVSLADREAGWKVLLFEVPSQRGQEPVEKRDSGERTGLYDENQRGEVQSRGTVENKDK